MKYSRFLFRINILAVILLGTFGTLQSQPYGDYTLYSLKNSTKAYLLNIDGSVYHSWTFASNAKTGYTTYLLPGQILLRTVENQGNYFNGGGMCGRVQKVDWNGTVLWDFVYSTNQYCSHHDICAMPNGNVLLIAYESKTPAEAIQAGCSQGITIWPDKIVEIEPSGTNGGTVVWEWHAWDHLCQNVNPSKDNYVSSIVLHPELININYLTQQDWMHVNGIDYNETLDQIVFSSHCLNEFYVVDHSTTTAEAAGHTGGNSGKGGDLLYRWGNPHAYQASGTTNFNVVHDAHWIPENCPKANYFAAFNNKGAPGNKSCIDLVDPPYDGYNYSITLGEAYDPPTYSWRHVYSGTPTQDEGTSQQLPNGNMLICISFSGYLYEIDSNQAVVWSKNVAGDVTSAYRYSDCYVNGTPPSQPVITVSGDTLFSSSTTGNQWYLDDQLINGATHAYLVPAENGLYTVQVTVPDGCVSPMSDPYSVTWLDIDDINGSTTVTAYPNPSSGLVTITGLPDQVQPVEVTIMNLIGNRISYPMTSNTVDLSGLKRGLYYLSFLLNNGEYITKKIVLMD